MPSKISAVLPVLLALLGAACSPESPARVDGSDPDGWYRLSLFGKPAGYLHQSVTGQPGGGALTLNLQKLSVRRGAVALELQVEVKVWEDDRGIVQRYSMASRMSQAATVSEGRVEGGKLHVTLSENGAPRTFSVDYDAGARGPAWIDRQEKALRKTGDRFDGVAFFPELNKCGKFEAVLADEELVPLPDGALRLRKRVHRIELLPGADLIEWVDAGGTVWKSVFKIMGMDVEQVRTTREKALDEKIASPPEIFFSMSVRPDRPLEHPEVLRPVLYRISLREGDFKSRRIDGSFQAAGQKVVREESPSSRVVSIEPVAPGKTVPLPVPAGESLRASLAPNAFIQSDDPGIQAAARRAIGDAADAFEAARRLESWVHGYITSKDLETGFASAGETFQSRKGDCTEHGVLLAAAARSAGIPARVATGLVYHDGAFVGHLWTEVFIDRWIPLDATRARGAVGADHIALGATDLADASFADVFLNLVQMLGNLKIDILEQ